MTHTHTHTHKHTLATPRTANERGLLTVRPIDPRSAYRGQHNVLGRKCGSSHVGCFLAVKTSVVAAPVPTHTHTHTHTWPHADGPSYWITQHIFHMSGTNQITWGRYTVRWLGGGGVTFSITMRGGWSRLNVTAHPCTTNSIALDWSTVAGVCVL